MPKGRDLSNQRSRPFGIPFRWETGLAPAGIRRGRSLGLPDEGLAAGAGAHGPPGARLDVEADEADRAVGQGDVDAAGVPAAGRRPGAGAVAGALVALAAQRLARGGVVGVALLPRARALDAVGVGRVGRVVGGEHRA